MSLVLSMMMLLFAANQIETLEPIVGPCKYWSVVIGGLRCEMRLSFEHNRHRRKIPMKTLLFIAFLFIFASPLRAAEPAEGGGPMRVLFIGNSYTSVNNLPGMVQALAVAAKEKRKF